MAEKKPWVKDPKGWVKEDIRIAINNKPPGEVCENIMRQADKLQDPKMFIDYGSYGGSYTHLTGWRKITVEELAAAAAEAERAQKRKEEQAAERKRQDEKWRAEQAAYRKAEEAKKKKATKEQAEALVAVLREAGYIVVKGTKTRTKKENVNG